MADENNTGDEQFTPDGSMEPLSPQEADTTDYGLMDTGERIQRKTCSEGDNKRLENRNCLV